MMEPYYSNGNQEIYCGDSLEILKDIPDALVDLVVTDPPYGYSFMGRSWDKVVIPTPYWWECLRVLKPGAFAFIMSAPRQDVLARLIMNLQDAGFETAFSAINWVYASGFPKAMNVSKVVDRRLGVEREVTGKDKKFGRTDSGIYQFNDGSKPNKYEFDRTDIPASEVAKKLNGAYAGFQPKPAWEVIVVVMKPLSEKTYLDQAMKNSKGVTWLDDGRIPFVSSQDKESAAAARAQQQARVNKETHQTVSLILEDSRVGKSPEEEYEKYLQSKGRFPANILVEDDVLNDGRTHKGSGGGGLNAKDDEGVTWRIAKKGYQSIHQYSDDGSFSRYFDLDAWWTERIKHLPESVQLTFPFLIVPKPSKREKDKGLEAMPVSSDYRDKAALSAAEHRVPQQRNPHPTVKALKLMSWLITIGSREGDVVLDPFVGSGTTTIAAKLLKRLCIGIDITPEYCEVARKRLEVWNE